MTHSKHFKHGCSLATLVYEELTQNSAELDEDHESVSDGEERISSCSEADSGHVDE